MVLRLVGRQRAAAGSCAAGDALFQLLIQTRDRAAVALDGGGDLLALGQSHADAFDLDVDDLEVVAHLIHVPIDRGRRRAIGADQTARDDVAGWTFGPRASHLDGLTAIILKAGGIGLYHPLRE